MLIFTYKWLRIWHNIFDTVYFMSLLPVMPLAIIFYEIVIRNVRVLVGLEKRYEDNTGGVFFVRPNGFLNKIIWDWYGTLRSYTGHFWIAGLSDSAI